MIVLFNALLVLIGMPLFGISMLLIGFIFYPALRSHLGGGLVLLQMSLMWVGLFIPFCAVYKFRGQWLEKTGILRSWRALQGYLREQHPLPVVAEADYARFRSRLRSSGREAAEMKAIYAWIQNERRDDKQPFVYALLRYFHSGDFMEFMECEFQPGQAELFVRAVEEATGFQKAADQDAIQWLNGLLRDQKFAAKLIDMGRNQQLLPGALAVVDDPQHDLARGDIRYILECNFPRQAPQREKDSCGDFKGMDADL